MGHLSVEAKENIVRKALNRGDATLFAVAKENNIGYSTIQRWLKKYNSGEALRDNTNVQLLNKSEQLKHIIATANLDDVSLGQYCRKHGLYSHQLQEWHKNMIKDTINSNSDNKTELKKLKQENTNLKQELKRKDKALAEASALLIMKKKANLIWGEGEVD